MPTHVPYRRLAELAGWPFLVTGFLARLPASMGQMGTLTLVSQTSGSYAVGGAAAGVLGVATAIGSPVFGALTDRFGQRPVVAVQGVVSTVGFVGLVLAAGADSAWAVLVSAAVGGFFVPQIGVMARVRWRTLVHQDVGSPGPGSLARDDGRPTPPSGRTSSTGGGGRTAASGPPSRPEEPGAVLSTAYAYESVADELGFVLGPALVGLMAAFGSPSLPVLATCALLLVFGTAFAFHPTASIVPVGEVGHRGVRGPARGLLVVSAAMFGLGCLFGALQTSTTVFAVEQGSPGAGGLLYALGGIGSALAGLGMPRLPAGWGLLSRLRTFATLALPLGLPLVLASDLVGYGAGLLVLGTCMAPYMITCFTLVERVVRPDQLGGATSLLPATVNIGYALAASIAGGASDATGSRGALLVAGGAVLVMNLVAWGGGLLLRPGGRDGHGGRAPESVTDA